MQTHDELVEAVYNNASYRSEVLCIIKLRARLESALKELSNSTFPEPDKAGKSTRRMLRYDDLIGKSPIIQFADSPEINWCRSGITCLYSALSKGLMHTHSLSTQQADKVLFDVLTRYTNG